MGRKPKPTRLKVLEGNPGKQKLPKGEPQPEHELPPPPSHLDAYGIEEWNRISEGLFVLGVLTSIDQQTLAAYCDSYSQWRTATEELSKLKKEHPLKALLMKTISGNWIQNPLVGEANKAKSDMMRYAAEFGLTPSARARLAIDPGRGKKSKFEGLIGGKTKK